MPIVFTLFSDLGEALYCLVIFGVLTAECLVAVWAATSPRPRLLRALIVWTVIALLIPIRAWWPALVLMINAVLVIAIIALARRRVAHAATAPPQKPWRFALSDLLILILLVGTNLALARYCRLPNWAAAALLPLLVLPLAAITACTCLAAIGPSRAKWAAATAALIPVAAAVFHWIDIGQKLQIPTLIRLQYPARRFSPFNDQLLVLAGLAICCGVAAWIICRLWQGAPRSVARRAGLLLVLTCAAAGGVLLGYRYADVLWHTSLSGIGRHLPIVVVIGLALAALALIVGAASWVADQQWNHPHARRRRAVRALAGTLVAVAALPAGWLYWQMQGETRYPPPQLVGVNNYARLAEIAQELGNKRLDQGQVLVDEAAPLLGAPNYVAAWALDAEAQRAPNMLLGGEVRMFHQHLSFAMYEAAERLEFDRAADYALAKVRYNTMLSRGGTTGHARMGDHFQEGHRWLEDNRARLSPAKSREVAEILERSTAELDSAELLEQRDVIFADRSGGWSGRLRQILGDR